MLSEENGMKWVFGSHIFITTIFTGWVAWLTAIFAAGEKLSTILSTPTFNDKCINRFIIASCYCITCSYIAIGGHYIWNEVLVSIRLQSSNIHCSLMI